MKEIAASVFEEVISKLTSPLTEEEKTPPQLNYDYGSRVFEGDSYDEAYEKFQEYCLQEEIGDGLPLTPPTPEAVRAMLAGTSLPPEEELGLMVPRDGLATVEKVAINAVMAGAKPEYLPVIIAAVEAMTDYGFNLFHISTGTLNSEILMWVNGPIAKEIGLNAKQGFIGHGNRANSTIGRALSLCMINIGWSLYSAELGMQGSPIRYCNFVFAENEEESPWESFAVSQGYGPNDSTVTLDECLDANRLGPSGGMVSGPVIGDMKALANMMRGLYMPVRPQKGPAVMGAAGGLESSINLSYSALAVYPALARAIAAEGYTKQEFINWLCDQHRIAWDEFGEGQQEEFKKIAESGRLPGLTPDDCKPGGTVPTFNPEHVAVIVAGGMTGQCVSFAAGGAAAPNADRPGQQKAGFVTKKIRGAVLTKSGK